MALKVGRATRCYGVKGSEQSDDRTVNLDFPSCRLSQRLRTAWKRGLDPSEQRRDKVYVAEQEIEWGAVGNDVAVVSRFPDCPPYSR